MQSQKQCAILQSNRKQPERAREENLQFIFFFPFRFCGGWQLTLMARYRHPLDWSMTLAYNSNTGTKNKINKEIDR